MFYHQNNFSYRDTNNLTMVDEVINSSPLDSLRNTAQSFGETRGCGQQFS